MQILQHTDIRDCSFQNLQLPYPAFYMHFGQQAGIEIQGLNGEPEYMDGAFTVAQWEGTSPARRRKLQSKLIADGYTLVHLVGEEIAHRADVSGSGTVAPHWRRGHWREQAHGERMSLRKRILIKPTLVNSRDVSDPLQVQGHVYKPSGGTAASPLA